MIAQLKAVSTIINFNNFKVTLFKIPDVYDASLMFHLSFWNYELKHHSYMFHIIIENNLHAVAINFFFNYTDLQKTTLIFQKMSLFD